MADNKLMNCCASGCAALALFLATAKPATANLQQHPTDAVIAKTRFQQSFSSSSSLNTPQASIQLAGGFLGGFGISQLGTTGGAQPAAIGPYYPPNYGGGYPAASGIYSPGNYGVRSRPVPTRHDTAHGGAGSNAYGYSYYNYYNGTWNGYRYRPSHGLGTYGQGNSGIPHKPAGSGGASR